MKLRHGFVSNSSTSSFILVGCLTSDLDLGVGEQSEDIFDAAEDAGLQEDGHLFGSILSSWGDDEGNVELDLSFPKLESEKQKVIDFLIKHHIAVPEIKIYGGITPC